MKPLTRYPLHRGSGWRINARSLDIARSCIKTVLAFAILTLLNFAATAQQQLNVTGAWQMTKQVANDGKKDTLLKQEQLKIYTDKYMMYASPRNTDSFGIYGIATYELRGDTIVENIFYTSSSGDVQDSALLKISQTRDGFQQMIDYSDDQGTFILIEDYKKVGRGQKSPLDGAWKQIKNISVDKNGDTTTNRVVTQFKVYQSGHFIWANPSKDPSSNNFVTAYGYGTFRMNGNNRCIETNINSTYHDLVGRPVNIDIQMISKNAYKQTITSPDGHRSIEVYERLR